MDQEKELPDWCYREFKRIQLLTTLIQARIDEYNNSIGQSDEKRAALLAQCLDSRARVFLHMARWNFFIKPSKINAFEADLDEHAAKFRRKKIVVPTEHLEQTVTVAFVDTETTGIGQLDEPISVAAVLAVVNLRTGKLVSEVAKYHGLREPYCTISPTAQAIHGISKEKLKGLKFDMLELVTIFACADLVIAHNAEFDARILRPFVGHLDVHWACSCWDVNWPTSNRRLDTVCHYLKIARPTPHDAMADAKAMMAALQIESGQGITYLGQLLSSKSVSAPLTRRLRKKFARKLTVANAEYASNTPS